MNTKVTSEPEKWLIEFSRHAWIVTNDPHADYVDSNPFIGYSYQDFFNGQVKFSYMRESDSEVIKKELARGQRFTPQLLLHFSDHHCDLFESLLTEGLIKDAKADRYHFVDIALLQTEAGNMQIAFLICCHLMRNGWVKETFKSKSLNSKTVPKVFAKELFEVLSAIIDSAGHAVCHERLEKELSTKNKSVQKTKL